MPDILMYVRETCPYCHRARGLLRAKGARWTEVDIDLEPTRRAEMIEKSGRNTVPQIFIGPLHVGGSDDLDALDQGGQLDPLLGEAGT